jgi:hypothetical protein
MDSGPIRRENDEAVWPIVVMGLPAIDSSRPSQAHRGTFASHPSIEKDIDRNKILLLLFLIVT